MAESKVLEKIKKLRERRPQGGRRNTKDIFFTFLDGDNIVRLVGEFLEVKTHYIAGNPKRKDRGLCIPDAFKGDDSIPYVINCPDWDLANEVAAPEPSCVICKLNRAAWAQADATTDPEEKKWFTDLASKTMARTALKWNVIDRRSPFIIQVSDDGEKKVLGFKIATFGMEAWGDLEGVFDQVGCDITDPDRGIDVNVVRGHNGTRTTYSAKAVLDGMSVRVTPLTDEERALELHDLRRVCGRKTDIAAVLNALHGDLRDLYDMFVEKEVAEQPPKTPRRAAQSVPASTPEAEPQSPETEAEPVRTPVRTREEVPAGVAKPDVPKGPPAAAASAPTATASADDDFGDDEFGEDDFGDAAASPASAAALAAKAPAVEVPETTAAADETSEASAAEDGGALEVDPSEWDCFGSIEPEHKECKSCVARKKCAAKAGIELGD